ncbi:MAG: hypothetical protein B6U72_04065 [Candidatus Altiarchaeales archaeon ex4484_2]|nr:MAG: hypothetical protein B6U72_04065 [Candidatus Altiarchaeales archaeon ex4484_2]
MSKRFVNQKRNALERYNQARNLGDVDEEIIPLLEHINSLDDFYTTSSCSGRITLLLERGSKKESRWLGKWHREITPGEVIECLQDIPPDGVVWFKYESAILHIAAKTIEKAKKILYIVRDSGYKRVGLQGLKKERYLVEVCDTERVDCPLAEKGRLLVDEKYLTYLTAFSNRRFRKGRKKLSHLESSLKKNLS